MHHRKRPHDGFTLIELLVAITVTILMMGLVNLVFVQMTVIVGKGTAASKMLGSSRTMREQLARDAKGMKGPGRFDESTHGFLVIVNQQIENVEIATGTGATIKRTVNSDQLFFLYDNTGVNTIAPLCPNTRQDFASSVSDVDTVRIWWGHVRVTDINGTDDDAPPGFSESRGQMGKPLGSQWVLGRQALFLGDTSGNFGAVDARDARLVAGTLTATTVVGYGFPDTPGFPDTLYGAGGNSLYLYMGLTDITSMDTGFIFNSANEIFPPPVLLFDGSNNLYTKYMANAIRFGFATLRLRANPLPFYEYDPSAANPSEYSYASWQIAQMHPIFMENVSDFIVEFAGDYLPAGAPDGKLDVNSDGAIIWYRHFDDAGAVKPPAAAFNQGPGFNLPSAPHYEIDPDGAPHADAYFVFRHDNDGVTRFPAGAGHVTPNYWPHLLRIRYRIHDRNGRIIGADGTPGKWFEHVIKVNDNRP